MKILTVVGARPQFIKAAPVSKELRKTHTEVLVHTGQHYDDNMSKVFFDELNIPQPDYNLDVGSGSHAVQTGHMMMELEEVMINEKPDFVIIYGDTNSTLAGALTASKLDIPIGHIEAGLRNFDMSIPEEINRVIADRLSTLLFCPTVTAVNNLKDEGMSGVHLTGDVMYDALIQNIERANEKISPRPQFDDGYIFLTLHRPCNVDTDRLKVILNQLKKTKEKIIFPIHPRTQKELNGRDFSITCFLDPDFRHAINGNIFLFEPLSYLESIYLINHAKKVVTDSGGVQKEAYILKTPCITVFPSTAWEETVADGWNVLVEPEDVADAVKYFLPTGEQHLHYGDGHASQNIVKLLNDYEHTHFKSPYR